MAHLGSAADPTANDCAQGVGSGKRISIRLGNAGQEWEAGTLLPKKMVECGMMQTLLPGGWGEPGKTMPVSD